MRYERQLCDIYYRWQLQPGNFNVPDISADEALLEVVLMKRAMLRRNDLPISTRSRAAFRMEEQIGWLHRFIEAWRFFEGQE